MFAKSTSPTLRGLYRFSCTLLLLPLMACSGGGADPGPGDQGSGDQGGGSGGNSGGGSLPRYTSPSNYLAHGERASLRSRQAYGSTFTLSEPTRLVFHVAVSGRAQSSIMRASERSKFEKFSSFFGYGTFDGKYGTRRLTLPAGSYFVGIRNTSNATIATRFELDLEIEPKDEKGAKFRFAGRPVGRVVNVTKTLVQAFTVDNNHRIFIDGCSNGLESYLIPPSEVAKFQAGQKFNYYKGYGGSSNNLPGFWEVRLQPGTHYIALRNTISSPRQAVFFVEKWRVDR